MTLRTRFLGGFSQKVDTVENFIPLFFSPKKLAQLILLKESPDRKMKKNF